MKVGGQTQSTKVCFQLNFTNGHIVCSNKGEKVHRFLARKLKNFERLEAQTGNEENRRTRYILKFMSFAGKRGGPEEVKIMARTEGERDLWFFALTNCKQIMKHTPKLRSVFDYEPYDHTRDDDEEFETEVPKVDPSIVSPRPLKHTSRTKFETLQPKE